VFETLELTGRASSHVIEIPEFGLSLQPDAAAALQALRRSARRAGLDPWPVSGFRSFERQLAIWNAKFRGERPLLDRLGQPLRASDLDVGERVTAILCWSALPGASRHHWGSDVDLVDRAALAGMGERTAQLVAAEYAAGGPFAPLAAWLERHARRFGFYRPYLEYRGGVAPEPWHYSFAPAARVALAALTPTLLREAIEGAGIEGRDWLLPRIEDLHRRYVAEVDRPPRMRSRWVRRGA
jgi:LAS superfamily LD-carboxypeptidase LdcB